MIVVHLKIKICNFFFNHSQIPLRNSSKTIFGCKNSFMGSKSLSLPSFFSGGGFTYRGIIYSYLGCFTFFSEDLFTFIELAYCL